MIIVIEDTNDNYGCRILEVWNNSNIAYITNIISGWAFVFNSIEEFKAKYPEIEIRGSYMRIYETINMGKITEIKYYDIKK